MSEPVETITVGALTARIELDTEPNPRDADNLGRMVCLHRRHSLGDPHDYRAEDHSGWDDLEQHILRDHHGAVLLPLYMMDHSGLTMSTTDAMFRAFDGAAWDWGRLGLIYASAESIRSEYGVEGVLRAEVEEYDTYLRGDTYSYVIQTADGEVLDSCCGVYGLDHALAEARAAA